MLLLIIMLGEIFTSGRIISMIGLVGLGSIIINKYSSKKISIRSAVLNTLWILTKGYVIVINNSKKVYIQFAKYYNKKYGNLDEKNIFMINKQVIRSYTWDQMPTSDARIEMAKKDEDICKNTKMVLFKWKTVENTEFNIEWKNLNLRFSSIMDISDNFIFSKINFLAIELNLNEKEVYNIDFKDENFYINSNIILDKAFCEYWLYKDYGIELKDKDTYIVSFMDHDMKYVSISQEQGILINVNDYTILSKEYLENIENIETINETRDTDWEHFDNPRKIILDDSDCSEDNDIVNIIDMDKPVFQKWWMGLGFNKKD